MVLDHVGYDGTRSKFQAAVQDGLVLSPEHAFRTRSRQGWIKHPQGNAEVFPLNKITPSLSIEAHMNDRPDFELDAYLVKQGQRSPLCDVRVWLSKQPADDGRMEVQAFGLPPDNDLCGVGFSLVNDEEPGFYFEANDILIRSSTTQPGRRVGGTTLKFGHIGRLTIQRNLQGRAYRELQSVKSAIFQLSQVHYAIPSKIWTMDFEGNRSFSHANSPPRLQIHGSSGGYSVFELDRHWNWVKRDDGDTVVARSTPVLAFHAPSGSCSTPLNVLKQSARTAALLLSLAARWRVVVHGFHACSEDVAHEEWDYPLSRMRAADELENSREFLVHPSCLESFIQSASSRISSFGEAERDAISLSIYSLHPTDQKSIESRYLALCIALEGLARQFGSADRNMHIIVPALLRAYPPGISGLWPILGEQGLPGLKNLRNELAHGRNFSNRVPGSLSLAIDHLQLWIEYFLLSILNGRAYAHESNWLARHVIEQREEMNSIRVQLSHAGITDKS